MKKIFIVLSVLLCFLLVGCSKPKEKINVYNWGEYMDLDLLKQFTEETGIEVVYDTFVMNEDLYVKMTQGTSKYDLVFPSDYIIEKMINEDLLQKIDYSKIPNMKNIDPKFRNLAYDPNEEYSVPYLWGTLGIVYNKTMVNDPVDSWDILWNENYKNNIIMLDSSRDSIGLALKKLGYSLNSRNENELNEAKELLLKQKELVRAYLVDETKDAMNSGEAALAVMYSGDASVLVNENPDMAYAIPKEGSNFWYDSMVIPKDAPNYENTLKFIDFLCRPDIAIKNCEFIEYAIPLKDEVLGDLDPELKSEINYPDLNKLNDMEVFNDPGEAVKLYDQIWSEVKAY